MTFSPESEHDSFSPARSASKDAAAGSRWLSNLAAVAVVALMAGGIWWWSQGGRLSLPDALPGGPESDAAARQGATHSQDATGGKADDSEAQSPNGAEPDSESPAPTIQSQAVAANGNSDDGDHSAKPPAANGGEPRIDLSQTSWENPFAKDHWESKGWTFDGESMQSADEEFASASFLREYRKLTIDCRIEAVGDPGTFQIALFAPETNALMKAEFTPKLVRVTSDIRNRRKVIKSRDFPVPFAGDKPVDLRLTATGNRVLIVSNGQVVLSLNQPAEQSGKQCRFSLRATGGRFRISRLHLEGE